MQICWEILNIKGLIISFKINKICGLKMEVQKIKSATPYITAIQQDLLGKIELSKL